MKFEQISFAIVGGDLRQVKLCDYLISHGYSVHVFGFSNTPLNPIARKHETLEDAISLADIVIGPIPCSQNDKDLFTKYYDGRISIESVFRSLKKNQIFMAGRLTPAIQESILQYGIKTIDLLERDDMAIRNAAPTVCRKSLEYKSLVSK